MAARKQLFHPDVVKQKIQVSQLINRLQNFALFEGSEDEEVVKRTAMSPEQVRAAFGLINKVVPDARAEGDGQTVVNLNLGADAKKA